MAKKPRLSAKDGNKLYASSPVVQPGGKEAPKSVEPAGDRSGSAKHCLDEIDRYEKAYGKWERCASSIVDRYRDKRDEASKSTRSFNVLWSNVQILKPTLYARVPKPEVVRRFK